MAGQASGDRRVTLLSRMTAKPGCEDALATLILGFYNEVRAAEPGCLTNIMHRGAAAAPPPSSSVFSFPAPSPGTFTFYEVYADPEAAQLHPTTAHFARMAARLPDLIDGPVEIRFLDRVGGIGTT